MPIGLYGVFIDRFEITHRFLISTGLPASKLHTILEGVSMLDLLMLGLGTALFALTIGYAVACDRL
jgi:hypothetical protein